MKVVFQGIAGSYSHMSCQAVFPEAEAVPAATFEEAFRAVSEGRADRAMIPIENGYAGRVTDIHHLLPKTDLHIIAEHFQPVNHCLLGVKGAVKEGVKVAESHLQALMQCTDYLKKRGIAARDRVDTAVAARDIAASNDPTRAAVASRLAAEIYGLEVLDENIQDMQGNTTRFVIFSRKAEQPAVQETCITSFLFEVRNVPAALYKALGGFATNGINLIRLESYMNPTFQNSFFYTEVQGHIEHPSMMLALEELDFFSKDIKILGTYRADKRRGL